ncbi:MAG TPA: hypothetical protein VIL46_03175, partial [Gemmataceae bacterium]
EPDPGREKGKDGYQRKVEIVWWHSAGGNVNGYTVPLENSDPVNISQSDGSKGFEVGIWPSHYSLRVRKDEKGKVCHVHVGLGHVGYDDIDADGMIDGLYDGRGGGRLGPRILFEGRFVKVEDSRTVFNFAPNHTPWKWGVGREVRYVFQEGAWKAWDPKDPRPTRWKPVDPKDRARAERPPRKFGPEWEKVGDGYRRTVEVPVTQPAGAGARTYMVPLEHGVSVFVREYDGNRGVAFGGEPSENQVEILKDEKGKVRQASAWIAGSFYVDLDADGMIDALSDNRNGKRVSKIFFEGRLVGVEDSEEGFRFGPDDTPRKWGVGRGVRYVFENGAWRAEDPKGPKPRP